ncbi:tetratricopeptide repeat protein [Streptomyces sp. NPDC055099]
MAAHDLHRTTVHEAPPPGRPVVTHGLPQDIAGFIGREQELERLLNAAGPGRVLNVHTVDGMPGVGKTALATRAAHLLTEQFPDGQFFCDLHAHTPGLPAARPVDVLAVLLTDLGIDPRSLPPTLEGRSHLWRDRLAGKRFLLVLDDAVGHAQIQPLLPGGDDCLTLVTSRRRLIALDGAAPLPLAPLTPDAAVALFTSRCHRSPAGSEQTALAKMVARCGYLPLAIVLLAGRLRHKDKRAWSIARFASEFADAQDRLSELHDGDNRAVYTAFLLSYKDLSEDQQRFFRRIGLHPGPDVDAYAAAALDDIPLAAARRRLESLYTDHLLDEPVPGRYQLHDLLREYARALAIRHDQPAERTRAAERLLDYYQHTAQIADRHLNRVPCPRPPPAAPPAAAPSLPDWAAALTWMRTERNNLLACLYTAGPSPAPRVVGLTAAMAAFLRQEGPWPQAVTLHQRAATAAGLANDSSGEADALNSLGDVRYLTGDYEQAVQLHERALALYEATGSRLGQANALWNMGRARMMSDSYAQAVDLQRQALALYESTGSRLGQANALWDMGRALAVCDNSAETHRLYERALVLYEVLGDRLGQANALWTLGRARMMCGVFAQAAGLQERALTLYEVLGDRLGQANAMWELGHVRAATGDFTQAAQLHQQALTLYQALGNRHAQANALWALGRVRALTGHHVQAAQMQEQALALFRAVGSRLGEANALNDLGHARALSGDYRQAARLHEQALILYQAVGDLQGEAELLNNMGVHLAQSPGPQAALATYQRALELARQICSPLDEARALDGAARCLAHMGDRKNALANLREAVGIYQRIGAAEAPSAAQHLAHLQDEEVRGASDVNETPGS